MTTPSDIEFQAAEWLLRMEGTFDKSVWDDFQRWLGENPNNRRAYVEMVQVWKGTEVLRTVGKGRDPARERSIPELLTENSDLREKLQARGRGAPNALTVDVAHIEPQLPSGPLYRVIDSIVRHATKTDPEFCATRTRSQTNVVPLRPMELSEGRRK